MSDFLVYFTNNLKAAFSTPANVVFSVLDILVTVVLIYALILFLKNNNAQRLIKYLAVLLVFGAIAGSKIVDMPIAGKVFGNTLLLLVLALIILFAPNARRILWKLASPSSAENSYSTDYGCPDDELHEAIDEIVRATQYMSKKDVGALIIIAPDNIPEQILDSGTRLNAELSCPLIECLFNTKAPLHDGAVYIRGNKILAAGCFLPLTEKSDLDKELGTRHRAAIGITEQYNHLAIIVSEETGIISVARNGEITRYFDSHMLTDVLEQIYGLKAVGSVKKHAKKHWRF